MTLTVRFAHLDYMPLWTVDQPIIRGNHIGRMGSSGQSTAAHLHIDLTRGENANLYSLQDIEKGNPSAGPILQLVHFLDDELFGVPIVVTTPYAELDYYKLLKKIHHGFDVVPEDRRATKDHYEIFWNRSMPGKVIRVDNDPYGYGYHVNISFEV